MLPYLSKGGRTSQPRIAIEAMVMWGHRQLREVFVCMRHQHPLVLLWERFIPTERSNMAARLGAILELLLDGGFEKLLRGHIFTKSALTSFPVFTGSGSWRFGPLLLTK